jgi:hypothetical protein
MHEATPTGLPALIADGWSVNGGPAMTANDVLAILAIAFGATDAASVEGGAVAVGFLNNYERQSLIADVGSEEMQLSILNLGKPQADFLADGSNGRRRRRSRISARSARFIRNRHGNHRMR